MDGALIRGEGAFLKNLVLLKGALVGVFIFRGGGAIFRENRVLCIKGCINYRYHQVGIMENYTNILNRTACLIVTDHTTRKYLAIKGSYSVYQLHHLLTGSKVVLCSSRLTRNNLLFETKSRTIIVRGLMEINKETLIPVILFLNT